MQVRRRILTQWKKAYATGASKSYIIDIQDEFIAEYIWPTLKAGAIYENDYLLGTSMARPLRRMRKVSSICSPWR